MSKAPNYGGQRKRLEKEDNEALIEKRRIERERRTLELEKKSKRDKEV